MKRLPSEPDYIRERRLIRERIERDKRYSVYICIALALGAVFFAVLFLKSSPLIDNFKYKFNDIDCEILVTDFSYGNGVYFECEGETVLVDSGNSQHTEELLGFIESNNISNLNYLLITEIDEDYLITLKEILDLIDVSRVVIPCNDDKSLVELYDKLTFPEGAIFLTSDQISYFTLGKMKFSVIDSRGLSLDITFGNHNFMVLNGKTVEHMNLKSKPDILILKNGDLLKNEILEMLKPKNCIINSVLSENMPISKNHSVYITDTVGSINIYSDEVSLKIECEKTMR